VVADLPNPDGALKSGLLAEVELGANERAEAPADAPTAPRSGRPAPKAESKVR
jgi:hypothetical protein